MADVEMVGRVLDQVEANPESFDTETWVADHGVCGTTACVAGWAAILSGRAVRDPKNEGGWIVTGADALYVDGWHNTPWHNAGRDALGISERLATRLFHTTNAVALGALRALHDGVGETEVRALIVREELEEYAR